MKKTTANKLKHGDVYTVLLGDGKLDSSVWIRTISDEQKLEYSSVGYSHHNKAKHVVVFLYNVYKIGAKLTKGLNEKS